MALKVVDLFCGAGGLSLGFKRAGCDVVLSNEYSVDAEWTYRANHLPQTLKAILGDVPAFPEEEGHAAENKHRLLVRDRLLHARADDSPDQAMRGGDIRKALSNLWLERWLEHTGARPDVMIGGPPCQGFSSARGRLVHDERNQLVHEYARVVSVLQPRVLVIENVPGMVERHPGVVQALGERLASLGYVPRIGQVTTASFGVPQSRRRVLIIAVRYELIEADPSEDVANDPLLQALLPVAAPVCRASPLEAWDAIPSAAETAACHVLGDLSTHPPRYGEVPPLGVPYRPGHSFRWLSSLARELRSERATYLGGRSPESADQLMKACRNHEVTSHSFAVTAKFMALQAAARNNPAHRCSSGWLRDFLADQGRAVASGKCSQRVLVADEPPAVTITSLPDDLIHYGPPRILSVRECARLQTFPDWFEFRGVRTTGFNRRREGRFVPQYTQVANGVPPRLAHGIAQRLKDFLGMLARTNGRVVPSLLPHGEYRLPDDCGMADALVALNRHFMKSVGKSAPSRTSGVA